MQKFLILILLVFGFNIVLSSQKNIDTLTFESNGSMLMGYFYASPNPQSPTLLFTQGFMSSGDIWGIGKTLSERGINVFQFDFRGCFQSEGKQGLHNSQEDIGAALTFLQSAEMTIAYNIDPHNIVVGGYSYGGHMSLLYAMQHPDTRRVISISGGDLGIFTDVVIANPDLRKSYSDFFTSIKKPLGPVDFEYDDPIRELMDHQDNFYLLKQTDRLSNVDILLTGGLDDNVVSMEEYVIPLYRKLQKNKSLNVDCKVFQTGHSYKNVSEELMTTVENWIKKK